jgi:hypothetical protein
MLRSDVAAPAPEREASMQSTGPVPQPDPPGGIRARFGRRPVDEPRLLPSEYRLADVLQRAVEERLEVGLQAIEEHATDMMREIAGEIWRTGGGDVRPEQERIVSLLSRDQAVKSLIASSDERFQALAVRSARLEDSLRDLAETGRSTRRAMEVSATAVREIAESPTMRGVELVRTQLEQVERHIAETMAHLDEHERALSEGVLRQVREHGELIARETTRMVEAMQGYVQSGAEAMGRLAQRVEAHADAFASGESGGLEPVRQQIEMLDERMGIQGRSLHELQSAVERLVEARIIGLAQLIRSDSEALRDHIERRSDEHEASSQALLQERLAEVRLAIESRCDSLASDTTEQLAGLATSVAASVDSATATVTEQLAQLDGLDAALVETRTSIEERLVAHVDDRVTAIARMIRSDNQVLAERLRTGAGEDGELMKQVLRSMKELEAGVAGDVMGSMDRRFQAMGDRLHQESQSTAEAIVKVAEMLGERIDRLAVKVDEGMDGDLQIVIDRMSDAIQAMSARGARRPRIELD